MNIQRLEMMKQMMGRVVAGSWEPVLTLPRNERFISEVTKITVTSVDLKSWSDHKTGRPNNTCGFSACAVGHACFDEEFRKLGWEWDGAQPKFGSETGIEASATFFDITKHQAKRLFMPESYMGADKHRELPANVREAKMVADRIQKLINTGRI